MKSLLPMSLVLAVDFITADVSTITNGVTKHDKNTYGGMASSYNATQNRVTFTRN